jgi:hypothetical protein
VRRLTPNYSFSESVQKLFKSKSTRSQIQRQNIHLIASIKAEQEQREVQCKLAEIKKN